MKTLLHFLFVLWLLLCFFPLRAQEYRLFDPARDPVARLQDGSMQITVEPALLKQSLSAGLPESGNIQDVLLHRMEQQPILLFHCQTTGAGSLYIAIPLRESAPGEWMAEARYQSCMGDPCEHCAFNEAGGCACLRHYDPNDPLNTGRCNHGAVERQALGVVRRGG